MEQVSTPNTTPMNSPLRVSPLSANAKTENVAPDNKVSIFEKPKMTLAEAIPELSSTQMTKTNNANNNTNNNYIKGSSPSTSPTAGPPVPAQLPLPAFVSPQSQTEPQRTRTAPYNYNFMENRNGYPRQVPILNYGSRSLTATSRGPFQKNHSFRANLERAVRERKIFCVVGLYPAIRNALKKRGWMEKNPNLGITQRFSTTMNALKELETKGSDEESDQAWANRVLREYPPDFIWVIRRDNIDWRMLHREQMINRYPRAYFTTKVGITACLQNMHWFSETGVSDILFPRCYRLCLEEEKNAFVDDYRLCACLGLLKWIVYAYEKEGESGIMNPGSNINSLCVDFAVRQVSNYVRTRKHEDIDWLIGPTFMNNHWEVFLSQYQAVVFRRGKLFPRDATDTGKSRYDIAKKTLQRVAVYWPQMHVDGMNNVWICKPGARSRGKGIIIMNDIERILELLAQSNYREANWVVQKYIEKPMLIYKTKFDIRQWFIVTDWSPLTVWFYKESYVRFCSKPFTLDDFHESIHLCNNAVQVRYQNSELRDSALPDENMWDCYTFQAYLKTIGKMELWASLIYPKMKEAIIGVLLASQESSDVRKNCFELYGADFMLSEDCKPWLIEINSCPCMAGTTSVTARMCGQCLEDTIKVVLDRKENRNADTGLFEMVFRQNLNVGHQAFTGMSDLMIQGKKVQRDVDWPSILSKYQSTSLKNTKASLSVVPAQMNVMTPAKTPLPTPVTQGTVTNGMAFMDLVSRLRIKELKTSPPANPPMFPIQLKSPGSTTVNLSSVISSSKPQGVLQQKSQNKLENNQNKPPVVNLNSVVPYTKPPTMGNQLRSQNNLDSSNILNVKRLETLGTFLNGPNTAFKLNNGQPNPTTNNKPLVVVPNNAGILQNKSPSIVYTQPQLSREPPMKTNVVSIRPSNNTGSNNTTNVQNHSSNNSYNTSNNNHLVRPSLYGRNQTFRPKTVAPANPTVAGSSNNAGSAPRRWQPVPGKNERPKTTNPTT